MQYFAVYDLDKTITRRATWTRFLLYAARRRAPWRMALLPLAGMAALGHPLGLVRRGRLKEITLRLMLGRAVAADKLEALAARYAQQVLANDVLAAARARIAADRGEGRTLVLASASPEFYVAPIAAALGFDAVVATRNARNAQGQVLARLAGGNCYGPEKLARVVAWFARQGCDRRGVHVRVYSDHVSDAPLLAWADEAFAVNAHAPLARVAAERGWAGLDWRG